MNAEFLTVDEFRRKFRIGKSTAYKAIENGELRVLRIGRAIRISQAAVEEFTERNESQPEEVTV